jgi:hypothetical protein
MNLIPAVQTAIGPVILISGVGLLLLTMTNRLGRTIDRTRVLVNELGKTDPEDRRSLEAQLRILWKRARLLRAAITGAAVSALCAATLVSLIFLLLLADREAAWAVAGLFIMSMGSLVFSLTLFIQDINQSLGALKLEIHPHGIDA